MASTHFFPIADKEILSSTAQVVLKFTLIWNMGGRGHHMSFGKFFCFLCHFSLPLA